ncbi:type I restriction endonuclease subunit R [Cysteiniphilum sp. 6C5]|uniref:type I restriction endonuclease subunit R n=1 Tax=unclassified Cysteiniphilum TaxID=2610889 RepID=UPI003F849C3B
MLAKPYYNEDSRVKIPTILHLMKLGYQYLSLKGQVWNGNTNIFPEIFTHAMAKINPHLQSDDIARILKDLELLLDNEDLGKAFFERITDNSSIKFIDFDNFDNNAFHVVTELRYQNEDQVFRPDITLLINGMPLIFIEVKIPNNREGILAERNRINERFQNPRFRRFVNITQFMIFSNNMEYGESDLEPLEGAFYASSSYEKPVFNYFREEEIFNLNKLLKPLSEADEIIVLKDNNIEVIRNNPEFITNKDPNRATNRICTSLLSRARLAFILRYGLTYVSKSTNIQNHIMRYPQLFATKAIEETLDKGIKKGIIWHTQGSGKTALTYYNIRFLTDYFQRKNIIPKFYFIVDRLDLLKQSQAEFVNRGLKVQIINSREAFARHMKMNQVIHNDAGISEITVVNIQKFHDDPNVVSTNDYDLAIQRIYFLDEVHRSYNPKGSFLANLKQSDETAIHIGLTGTPLLGDDYNSRDLFGNYIHKYYYNASIADGYTLRLIREEISTEYKLQLQQALAEAELKSNDIDREKAYAHPSFVEPMLDFIISDFEKSRNTLGEPTIAGMVICDSSEQAKQMFRFFQQKYASSNATSDQSPELKNAIGKTSGIKSAALILHDVGTEQDRDNWIKSFKVGEIDILFVYRMLLTGFDAPRLKKLYLGRIIYKHNLLQSLTRVNRTYKNLRYGYVVDFADIRKEFDATNKAYFDELQAELGSEIESYSKLFKSEEEIRQEIEHIKDILFGYNIDNAELFTDQINQIIDRERILSLKKALGDAKSLYNLIRLQGESQFLQTLDFDKLNLLYREASRRLDILNLKVNLEDGNDSINLLNIAFEDIIFQFTKVGEEELILADQLKDTLRKTREALVNNFDQKDPEFITLKEALEQMFKNKKFNEITQDEMSQNITSLNKIHEHIRTLNHDNERLRDTYHGDQKYVRIHKRLKERQLNSNDISATERKICSALQGVKQDADEQVLNNYQILNNEEYFKRGIMPCVINRFKDQQQIPLNSEVSKYINSLVVSEYLKEANAGATRARN